MFVLTGCAGIPQNSEKPSETIPEITMEEFEEHLMNYFLDKNDKIIYETISIYRNNDYTEMLEQIENIILFFLYGVKTDNITKYNNFKEVVNTHDIQKLINIFYIIDNNDIALFLKKQEPSPELNDIYWTLYFSSGDVQYIDYLLIIIMQYYNEKENISLYLITRSAIWSIASNAASFSQIKEYIATNEILNNEMKRYILDTAPNRIHNETVEFIQRQREKGIW
jgi:hypothetical protein